MLSQALQSHFWVIALIALERMAVERDDAFIRTVEVICPPGRPAFRFLKVPSNVSVAIRLMLTSNWHSSSRFPRLIYQLWFAPPTRRRNFARQHLMDHALTDEEVDRRLGKQHPLAFLANESVNKVDDQSN